MERIARYMLLPILIGAPHTGATQPIVEYELRDGHSSNLFEDTSNLSGNTLDAQISLRGNLERETHTVSYGLAHAEKWLGQYRFADEHRSSLTLGYLFNPSSTFSAAIEAEATNIDGGDLLASIAGLTIGYRQKDVKLGLGGKITAEMLEGVTTATAKILRDGKGIAKFDEPALLPTRLEASINTAELGLEHKRQALGGTISASILYRGTIISTSEQDNLVRFPASTLRGALSHERKLTETLALRSDLGLVTVHGNELSDTVSHPRLYWLASSEWQALPRLGFGISYTRDMEISDIDDAIGEYVSTLALVAKFKLAEKATAKLSYETSSNEWLYYLYSTRTATLRAELEYAFAPALKASLEYRHLKRKESDADENFKVNEISARVGGRF